MYGNKRQHGRRKGHDMDTSDIITITITGPTAECVGRLAKGAGLTPKECVSALIDFSLEEINEGASTFYDELTGCDVLGDEDDED